MDYAVSWGDVATWVTGIATIALFIIGFTQIHNERISRIKAEKESYARIKRDQAEQISSWLVKYSQDNYGEWHWIAVLNQSGQPVYNVILHLVPLTQTGERVSNIAPRQTCIDVVPPGQGYVAVEALHFAHPGFARAGVEIAFQDKSGKNWVRRPNGELIEILESPIDYYKVVLPTSWGTLENELPPDEGLLMDTKPVARRRSRKRRS